MRLSTTTTGRGEDNAGRENKQHGTGTVGDCPDTLRVLGKFELVASSRAVDPSANCQRLLTLLAIRDCQISRASAAGILWPYATVSRANANLRSVLWKMQRCCAEVVEASFHVIRLAPHLRVDLQEVGWVARGLLDRSVTRTPGGLSKALSCNLHDDIVPDLGDEDWLDTEREQHRQLRLHALEALGEDLIAVGWYGAAVETAQSVIRVEPFRESARVLLVRAYLAEGNQLEAGHQHREYITLMRRELGLEPTDIFLKLGRALGSTCPPPGRLLTVPRRQPARGPAAGPHRRPMRVL
jgi:DNA-binding SARP family transcriptional activator